MAIVRTNNFESGVAPGTVIDSVVSAVGGNPFNSIDGAPKYTATRARGSLGLDCSGNAVPAHVTWTGLATKTFVTRFDVLIEAAPSTTTQALTVRNATNYVAGLNITTARKLAVTHWGGAALFTTATVLALNTWYRVELWGEVTATGSGILHFALFAGDSTTPLDTFDTTTADLQSTVVTMVRTGKHTTSGTMSWIIDNFAVGDTAAPLGPAANIPPTVTTGANQNVAAGDTANLTSTATDVDGTVVSRAWSFDYPTTGAPALTGATSAAASFTAGPAGSLYILRHAATDDAGATGSATTEIRVPSASSVRPVAQNGTGVGAWTRAGAATTDGAALADESDTTYIESPTASSTEANRRIRLAPSAVRTAGEIKVRVSQDAAGTLAVTARLYEGATLRQSWPVPTTTAVVEQTLTLSAGTLAAIADWGNLSLDLAVTG